MDALSRLLSLHPVHTALDIRCHFGAPWMLDHPAEAPGVAPYHLIVSGGGWLDMDGRQRIAVQAGDIVLFPHGAAHRLHTGAPQPLAPVQRAADAGGVVRVFENGGTGAVTDILCGRLEFGAAGQAGAQHALLAALPDLIHVRTAGRADFAGLHALIAMLRAETETVRPGAGAVVSQLASALFALLMRAWLEQAAAMPGLFALLAEPRLQPALLAMLAEPDKPWTLEQLAGRCHMSRATFARVFQKAAGGTPAAVLTQTRMARAAGLLAQGRLPVGQIAEQVGYQSEAAFNRVFKRSYGVGPGAYRRSAA
ncbi:AraC family transcriptional regulator [Massilia sp. Root418]|uniref:AraC family transcriptional regulator n=1 Tax=Massilia sp. Root418 TaxID=1736532 RepID=UPI0006F9E040|nr:AraC family transcriptional regulator [Massilia sp. Root418]KQW91546.1 AraC family transcriptional regulator [Massilia sp. Root418]